MEGDDDGLITLFVNTETASDIILTEIEISESFGLRQNYPNPFNAVTHIEYQLTGTSYVDLSVNNLLSEKIVNLVSKQQSIGSYQVIWNAAENPSGIYIYRLTSNGFTAEHKCMLLK